RSAPPRLDPGLLANHWLERIDYWGKVGFIVDFLDMSHDGIQIVTVVIRSESHKPHFVSGTAASIAGYGAAIEKSFHEAELGLVVMLTKPSKGITNIQDIKSPEDHGLYYSEESQYSKLEFLWSRCDSIESESFGSLDDLID